MRVTLALIAANTVVFAVRAAGSGGMRLELSREDLVAFGGLTAAGMADREWWRLVSSIFLHASLTHLAWNMAGLAFLGWTLESRLGPPVYALLYLVSGVVGSVATAAVLLPGTDGVAIGASGAVSGLIGAGAVTALRLGPGARVLRNGLAGWAALVIVNGFAPGTNNVAHAAGIVVGALLALPLVRDLGRFTAVGASSPLVQLIGTDRPPCPVCGARNPLGSAYCGRCGAALAKLRAQDVGPDHAIVPALPARVEDDRNHAQEEHGQAERQAQVP